MSPFLNGMPTEEDFSNALKTESEYWYLAAPLRNVLTLLSQCDHDNSHDSVTLKKKGAGR